MKKLLLFSIVLFCFVTVFAQAPTITSFSPGSGPVGTLVTVTGTNLGNPTAFNIGGVAAIAISNTGTQLVGMVMPGAVVGKVAVTTGGGSVSSSGNFTVTTLASHMLTQQGLKLSATGVINAEQGWCVSISADGNTSIAGGPLDFVNDNNNNGAAWVYTRSGTNWAQQRAELVGTGAVGSPQQGGRVSLSADGNTAIVSGNLDNGSVGAAWIFIRNGGLWTQQGSKLVGTGASIFTFQGYSASISADGNTAIIGGILDNSSVGAAWIFTRNGGVWAQQGPKLVGTGAIASQQGSSAALSADGNTAVVGGSTDNSGVGAVWIYTRSGGVWSQQGTKLVGTGASGASAQGRSVAVSADGNTIIVGGSNDNGDQGAVWVFTRNGGTWAQQGAKLVGAGAVGNAFHGTSVSLSADGNSAIVGGPKDDAGVGAIWIYSRSGNTWTQQGEKVVGSGAAGAANQGQSVALSADGSTVMVGGSNDNQMYGAMWAFNVAAVSSAPVISAVSTLSGPVGTPVTISGNNLNSPTTFTIGGVPAIIISNTGTQLVGMVMPGATNGRILIKTANGLVSSSGNFTVTATPYPSIKQSVLGAQGTVGTSALGTSVSVSADGNTAIIGGNGDNGAIGAAWIYAQFNGQWWPQGKLLGTNTIGLAMQGSAVSISADGNTAIVGGPHDNSYKGAVWIYTRAGETWTQQGSKIFGAETVMNSNFGSSVSLSADGNTAIVGGADGAWMFTRSNGVWTQEGAKLVGAGMNASAHGVNVALSADANTAVMGCIDNTNYTGAAWVFTRSGGIWTQQGAKLAVTGSVAYNYAQQICPVFLNADGNTAIMGADFDDGGYGAAWVFVRSGGVWTQQGSKFMPTDRTITSQLGCSVSLSADGNIAATGGFNDNGGRGAAWIYRRNGSTWAQQSSKLLSGEASSSLFGSSVVLSADGTTSLIGAPAHFSNVGGTWVFTSSNVEDATLSALSGTGITLSPKFSSATKTYTATVANIITSITITPTTGSTTATIKVNGATVIAGAATAPISLKVGDNAITTVVTAQDGTTTQTYSIIVTRSAAPASTVATLAAITISSGTLSPAFATATNSYTIAVGNSTTSIAITPAATDAGATVTVNGTPVTSGAASGTIPLSVGSNTITTVVTAQDGSTTQTYTLTVTRAASSIATLNSLAATGATLNPVFSPSTYAYTVSVDASFDVIALTPTVTDPSATVKVNGVTVASGSISNDIPLITGSNVITTVVTAQDGIASKTYTLTVTRAAPPVATIASISPATAVAGTTVTITGSNFTNATAVSFGGVPATSFSVVSANTITAIVGAGSSGDVSVTTPVNTVNFSGFNFVPVPTVTAAGPTNIISGGSVILNTTPASGYSYQWLRDGINITGATSSSYKATLAGVYTVSISLNSVIQVSPSGVSVNTVFELPANNFQFAITSATCKGSANGSISITATQNLAYTATITGNGLNTSYAFTNSTQINNLAAGTYDVCITVAGQADFQQCFTTVIKEPKDLSVYTAVSPSGDQVVVNMDGAAEYKIMLNGILYLTEDSQITLPLAKGVNAITVSSDSPCQGVIVKNINVSPEILVYPNPFTNNINLSLGIDNLKSALISVINVGNGQPVYTNIYNNVTGTLQIDLSGISSGLYLLRISGDNLEKVFKILKK